jgi:6-pyruvoyltetrahydropterin/6-carboxytetrahydropterin synthase
MYTISKQFDFSAAHQLHGLPKGHPCGQLHGHNYVVEVILESEELDARGFVVDYGELKKLRRMLDKEGFEHRNLNDIIEQPTAENIALFIYGWCKKRWPQTAAVRVSETPKTWAIYRP